jgi:methylenetetrahydrofolate--tRNA-(uracil-5-)-methyltransferase
VIGAGLAGCEAAWQLARSGVSVCLVEMKPTERTPAQTTDGFAELVCSNSLRSQNPNNAVGLLKEEMAALDSLIIAAAVENKVPAGDALAVERTGFSATIQAKLRSHPRIRIEQRRVDTLPGPESGQVVVATGPLTASALAQDVLRATGRDRLYFYDAIAPIVSGDSIDRTIAFEASRYGKGEGSDYLNCPLDQAQYEAFIDALLAAECMPLHEFEEPKFFQGCMPAEVVAAQGRETLRYGAMKPVGLRDPRTDKRPYAVLQLRKEDAEAQAYNLVGFQTKLKYPEQTRVFRMIPGLQSAEFLRLGAVHRNTYIDSPSLLDDRMRLKSHPHVRFAGQITGVEGYVESAAHGLITGLFLASDILPAPFVAPPRSCALGALLGHVRGDTRLPGRPHEPHNINWAMFPRVEGVRKREMKAARVAHARERFTAWLAGFDPEAWANMAHHGAEPRVPSVA